MGYELNKEDTTQVIPYAAAITPDAFKGDYVVVGVLTGNITVNAPINPVAGAELTLDFTQDGTGSRTITWDAAFLAARFTASTTAGYRDVVHFRYDGSHWVMQGSLAHVA